MILFPFRWRQIVGMNWLELKAGGWNFVKKPLSNCQYEIECE